MAPTIIMSLHWIPSGPIRHSLCRSSTRPESNSQTLKVHSRKTDLKKSIPSSPDVTNEPSHGDGFAHARLVTNLDLPLEHFVTRPLMLIDFSKCEQINQGHTYDNTDMCCRLLTQGGKVIGVLKNMALSTSEFSMGEAESPVFFEEKERHLQLRPLDVLLYIDSRTRGSHDLGDHCTPVYDTAVK